MKMSISSNLRRVAVTLLAILVVAATLIAVMAIIPEIKYLVSASLAHDAPIHGSTAADLQVIEAEHSRETWGATGIALFMGQWVIVMGIAVMLLRQLYHVHRRPCPAGDAEWADLVSQAEKISFMRQLEEALNLDE